MFTGATASRMAWQMAKARSRNALIAWQLLGQPAGIGRCPGKRKYFHGRQSGDALLLRHSLAAARSRTAYGRRMTSLGREGRENLVPRSVLSLRVVGMSRSAVKTLRVQEPV